MSPAKMIYHGQTSLYKGRSLFHLLGRLKNCGVGRVVYRTSEHYDFDPTEFGPSFYRVLLAQPEMDKSGLEGRVVAQRVFKGRSLEAPVLLTETAHKPDFRLVPVDEEVAFCRWDEVKPYDKVRDAPHKEEFIEMPPLMKQILAKKNPKTSDFRLPAHKIYMEEVNVNKGETRSADMKQFLKGEFADFEDFDLNLIPDSWTLERWNRQVGRTRYVGYRQGEDLEEQLKRDNRLKELQSAIKES